MSPPDPAGCSTDSNPGLVPPPTPAACSTDGNPGLVPPPDPAACSTDSNPGLVPPPDPAACSTDGNPARPCAPTRPRHTCLAASTSGFAYTLMAFLAALAMLPLSAALAAGRSTRPVSRTNTRLVYRGSADFATVAATTVQSLVRGHLTRRALAAIWRNCQLVETLYGYHGIIAHLNLLALDLPTFRVQPKLCLLALAYPFLPIESPRLDLLYPACKMTVLLPPLRFTLV